MVYSNFYAKVSWDMKAISRVPQELKGSRIPETIPVIIMTLFHNYKQYLLYYDFFIFASVQHVNGLDCMLIKIETAFVGHKLGGYHTCSLQPVWPPRWQTNKMMLIWQQWRKKEDKKHK